MKNWIKTIDKMGACQSALDWAEQFGTLEESWQANERGDWMLWLPGKLAGSPRSKSRKKLVLVACQCARLALPYVKKGEKRPLVAIEMAEAWARGEGGITLEGVRKAAHAAADAAHAAYAAHAAAHAAYAAADAAYAAAYAAADAADAAHAAYAAADAADAARKSILKKCADIVREYYPHAPKLKE